MLKILVLIRLLCVAFISLWSAGAIEYLPNSPEYLKAVLITILTISAAVLAFCPKMLGRWLILPTIGLISIFVVLLFQFFSLTPENQKKWFAPVARMPSVIRDSNLITINNISNFKYKTENDFIADYYSKTFNLDELSSVDFIVSYWEGKDIAHVITTFGFGEKDFVAFSIETRTEASEGYSTFGGFYRNYELIYVAADENDLIGLRTKIRNPQEKVYLFRTRMPPQNAKKLFLKYANEIEELSVKPRFYNTLTTNCTTQILWNVQTYNYKAKYNWKIFLSGHLPEYLYENGILETSLPFETLFNSSQINDVANQNLGRSDFSQKIREGLARPDYLTTVLK